MRELCFRRGLPPLPEELLPRLYRSGQWLTTTLGDKGVCAYSGEGRFISEPAYLKSDFVDATGAGDAFMAMMIRNRMASNTLEGALKEASEYAAEACKGLGALSLFPSRSI